METVGYSLPPNPYGPPQIQAYNPSPPQFPAQPSTTTVVKRETSLPAPFSPAPTTQSLPSTDPPPPAKKKVIRFGHGVGSGTTSTYRHKPPVWHPPPTYPYNLIPGRDFDAVVGRPKPVDLSDVFPGEGEGSGIAKPKKKKPAPPKMLEMDVEQDNASSTAEMKAEDENGSEGPTPSVEKPPPKKKEKKPKPVGLVPAVRFDVTHLRRSLPRLQLLPKSLVIERRRKRPNSSNKSATTAIVSEKSRHHRPRRSNPNLNRKPRLWSSTKNPLKKRRRWRSLRSTLGFIASASRCTTMTGS